MRACWAVAATLTAFALPTEAGVWDPPSFACDGTDEVAPGSSVEAWGLLDDCLVETETYREESLARWARGCRCAALARWLILWGDRSDLERAWRLYDELAEDHTLGLRVLDSMLDRVVADAIEEWGRGAVEAEAAACPGEDEAPPLPTELRSAPPALREAAHLFVGIWHASSVEAALAPDLTRVAFQGHEDSFRQTVVDFLRGRRSTANAARELTRYHWDHWCGTGSIWFRRTRARALIAAWLRLGEPRRAVCSAFGPLVRDEGLDEVLPGWDRRLLEAGGVDWETFFLGGLLHGTSDYAPALGRHGSERTALLLIGALDRRGRPGGRVVSPYDALRTLATMVEPGDCARDAVGSLDRSRAEDAPVILPDLEDTILKTLADHARPGRGFEVSRHAARLLLGLCRPESRSTFDRMRRSPFFEVRRSGTAGLRELGEAVPDPRPTPPVSFQILVDGHPFAGEGLHWRHWNSGTSQTDGSGVLRLDRTWFLDPTLPKRAVGLETPPLSSPAGLWLATTVGSPGQLDAVTRVEITTGRLSVVVPEWALRPFPGEESPRLVLYHRLPGPGGGAWKHASEPIPVTTTRVAFARLVQGPYAVVVGLPDGNALESPEVVVGEAPTTVELEAVPRRWSGLPSFRLAERRASIPPRRPASGSGP